MPQTEHTCPVSSWTKLGFKSVALFNGQCEVGANCIKECPFSYVDAVNAPSVTVELTSKEAATIVADVKMEIVSAEEEILRHPGKKDTLTKEIVVREEVLKKFGAEKFGSMIKR